MSLSPRRTAPFACALLCLALAAPALAQTAVRGPSQPPMPMRIIDRESQNATDKATDKAGTRAGQTKFPNIDTAKNRRDYELGTDGGADGLHLGRDEDTGENVMRATPPKKVQQKQPFEDQPIIVQPRIRR